MKKKLYIILFLLGVLTACTDSATPSSGKQKDSPYLRCAPTRNFGGQEHFKLPPLAIERDGYDMKISGIDRRVVILGLMAGINEPNEATLDNIAFFLSKFKTAGVQTIVVTGGLGISKSHTIKILKALAKAPVPILLLPGAQESYDVFTNAIKSLRLEHPQLIDMTHVRRVKVGHLNLISLPGYHNAFYLEAKERGCAYEAGDLSDVAALVEKDSISVLLSPSPPRGGSPFSVDRGRGGVNIGDEALTDLLADSLIQFGLFGHVYEAGGHATKKDGNSKLEPGVLHDSLFVQAGAVDAVPLRLIDNSTVIGMAQIVEFSGKRGNYRTVYAVGRR